MGTELIMPLIAGFISLLLGSFRPIISALLKPYLLKLHAKGKKISSVEALAKIFSIELKDPVIIPYADRINKTLESLRKASDEMAIATNEFNDIMNEKQGTIAVLEKKLSELSDKELEMKTKIETLQKVPIEALAYFEGILVKGDKRNAYRDYILFGAGVIVSVAITIVLKKMGY
ncbi:hypothetical protein [Mucilaginibacter lappiensis]|uniref:hypothetical protein n=1 Tax=Mucilaginibacter lappiensis TaxID=354630 RepID=UPI003D247FD3